MFILNKNQKFMNCDNNEVHYTLNINQRYSNSGLYALNNNCRFVKISTNIVNNTILSSLKPVVICSFDLEGTDNKLSSIYEVESNEFLSSYTDDAVLIGNSIEDFETQILVVKGDFLVSVLGENTAEYLQENKYYIVVSDNKGWCAEGWSNNININEEFYFALETDEGFENKGVVNFISAENTVTLE